VSLLLLVRRDPQLCVKSVIKSALNTYDAHSGKMIISAAAAGAAGAGAATAASASTDVVLEQALEDASSPIKDIGHVPLERAELMAGQGQAVDVGRGGKDPGGPCFPRPPIPRRPWAVRVQAVAGPAGAAAVLASSMAWLMLLCAVLGKGRGGRNERAAARIICSKAIGMTMDTVCRGVACILCQVRGDRTFAAAVFCLMPSQTAAAKASHTAN